MLTDATRGTHMWASDQVEGLIHNWPDTGDERKNLRWMHDQFVAWSTTAWTFATSLFTFKKYRYFIFTGQTILMMARIWSHISSLY